MHTLRPLLSQDNKLRSSGRQFRGMKAETDAAMARVLKRRKKQIRNKLKRQGLLGDGDGDDGQPSDIAKQIAAEEAAQAEKNKIPTEDEIMEMCGYDPSKADEYSKKEMDAFAAKAIKLNKSYGRTENGGVGDLTTDDGRNYGHYEPDFITGFFQKRKEKKEFTKRLAEERAKKYEGAFKGKKEKEKREDQEPTGLNTIFSRQGKREAEED